MSTLWITLIAALVSSSGYASGIDDSTKKELNKRYLPFVEGRTLYIKGTISSDIYDYLSIEEKNIREKIDVIELNSLGGSPKDALEIAQKIASLKKKTRLSKGHYCTSACVVIFTAGIEREMEKSTWLGIHAVRLASDSYKNFWEQCFTASENGDYEFTEDKKSCQETILIGQASALKMTNETFDLMERYGVSAELRKAYFAKEDDPAWPASGNVLKKPDWVLNKTEALKYNLIVQK